MNLNIETGKYVVAVSGGVDSVVLLELLRHRPDVELIVAHYDHGIREDSARDRQFVQELAERHSLLFVYDEGRLGPRASEAAGRTTRYEFFTRMRQVHGARAVVTAHHQDDVLETAILNLIRGSGRKGLTALSSGDTLVRPLLHASKADILDCAKSRGLEWREDSTNADEQYLRNYVRHRILPRFEPSKRAALIDIIRQMRTVNNELDLGLVNALHVRPAQNILDRQWFISLPYALSKEVMASWLRANGLAGFDARTLERLSVAGKTGKPGSSVDIHGKAALLLQKHQVVLQNRAGHSQSGPGCTTIGGYG